MARKSHVKNAMAKRIRAAIADAELTPAEVAKNLGISPAAVSQWMNGKIKNLQNQHLFALADLTGHEARWLATGTGPRFALPRDQHLAVQALLHRFCELKSDQDRQEALHYLDALIHSGGDQDDDPGDPFRLNVA